MKYSVTVKFIAIILCACALVTMAFSGIGIAFMEGYDLYRTPLETVRQKGIDSIGSQIAHAHAQSYANQTLSNAPQEVLDYSGGTDYYTNLYYGQYEVTIYENGEAVSSAGSLDAGSDWEPMSGAWEYVTWIRPSYPVVTGQYFVGENGPAAEEATQPPTEMAAYSGTATDATYPPGEMEESRRITDEVTDASPEEGIAPASMEPVDEALARVADQEPLYSEEYHGYQHDEKTGRSYNIVYNLSYYAAPEYEVRVKLAKNVLMGPDYMLVTALYPYRDYFIPAVLAGLVVFAICFVFLCTVAGRSKNGEVKLAAINRIPLDLYGICLAGLIVLQFLPVVWLFESAYYDRVGSIWDNPQLCLLICCLCGLGIGLCAIGFLYAFAAQVKAANNYWLRHTIIGWCFRQIRWVFRWALKGLGFVGQGFGIVGKGLKATGRGIRAVFRMLPTIWQWIVTAAAMVLVPFFFGLLAVACHGYAQIFWILLCSGAVVADIILVLYGGWCFGTLLKGIETMSKGNLNHKIDTRYLYGSFREFGEELNSLAGAARLAAERQLKSDRMKTELITNVSHDIKTPLTSIINFVDLMKKPHTEAEGEEYLQVLDRQSQRLKKLIDDLMDMSKASTGNVTVELSKVDAAEAINQALGEFADKLDRVNLTPVFRHPEKCVTMIADGKHLWRILSNLLNNAVKYALPDTRLYIDLMELQGNAVIAIKNISKEQLNVNADELMERFVRGDASRNTEGSGLGLNIAKSLVELQGGQMHLMVDGDLFKVTLIFPKG